MSVYHTAANQLRTTNLMVVKIEAPTVKLFTFKDKECGKAKPGQFLMLWVPGVDEIPLSILDAKEDGAVTVAVKAVGEATRTLHAKKVGETVGVRGPFGTAFSVEGGRVLMVGGGTGTAPLLFLAKSMSEQSRIVFVQGAKTKDELLFVNDFESILSRKNHQLIQTTEDGSCGIAGLCTTPLEQLMSNERFDKVYACGPESMVRKVFESAEKYKMRFEASLERLMRCAIGLCGSCIIGKYRVCRDGPVFTGEQLRGLANEFGVWKRDFDGRRIPV